jgi:hypothetical protein
MLTIAGEDVVNYLYTELLHDCKMPPKKRKRKSKREANGGAAIAKGLQKKRDQEK